MDGWWMDENELVIEWMDDDEWMANGWEWIGMANGWMMMSSVCMYDQWQLEWQMDFSMKIGLKFSWW